MATRAEEAMAGACARNPHVAFAEPDYMAQAISVIILDEVLDGVSAATVDLTTTLPDGSTVDFSGVTGVDGQ